MGLLDSIRKFAGNIFRPTPQKEEPTITVTEEPQTKPKRKYTKKKQQSEKIPEEKIQPPEKQPKQQKKKEQKQPDLKETPQVVKDIIDDNKKKERKQKTLAQITRFIRDSGVNSITTEGQLAFSDLERTYANLISNNGKLTDASILKVLIRHRQDDELKTRFIQSLHIYENEHDEQPMVTMRIVGALIEEAQQLQNNLLRQGHSQNLAQDLYAYFEYYQANYNWKASKIEGKLLSRPAYISKVTLQTDFA